MRLIKPRLPQISTMSPPRKGFVRGRTQPKKAEHQALHRKGQGEAYHTHHSQERTRLQPVAADHEDNCQDREHCGSELDEMLLLLLVQIILFLEQLYQKGQDQVDDDAAKYQGDNA